MTPPRMCPGCRALLDAGSGGCPYCGWDLALTDVRERGGLVERAVKPLGGLVPVIIFANVLLYLATALVQAFLVAGEEGRGGVGQEAMGAVMNPLPGVLVLLGAELPRRILERGEWWRLFCPVFLHAVWFHILVNMMALRNIGHVVDEAYGSGKALALYLLAGLAGTGASLGWYAFQAATGSRPPDIPGIGASGAIIGFAGMIAALGFRIGGERGKALWGPMVKAVGFILVLGIVLSFTGSGIQIDNSAHIGGFLFGLAAGFLCTYGVRSRGDLGASRAWDAAALVLVLAHLAAFVPPALAVAEALR